jgi:hypothetical protein
VHIFSIAKCVNLVLLCLNNTLCLIVLSRGIFSGFMDDVFVFEMSTITPTIVIHLLDLSLGHSLPYAFTCSISCKPLQVLTDAPLFVFVCCEDFYWHVFMFCEFYWLATLSSHGKFIVLVFDPGGMLVIFDTYPCFFLL